jgi:hypothetical protein
MGKTANSVTRIRTVALGDNGDVFLIGFLDQIPDLVFMIVLLDQDAVELAIGDAMPIT